MRALNDKELSIARTYIKKERYGKKVKLLEWQLMRCVNSTGYENEGIIMYFI